jgi:hypothetical protein
MDVVMGSKPSMESAVKPGVILRALLGAILSIGLLTLGCSSDNSPTTKADAGKKDTGAGGGSGGKGGSGGSSARGGSSGSGGSSASGGSSGSGGSGGGGGSSASGGSGGTGASGGAGGSSNAGGSGGSGGSGGTGGTNVDDAGSAQADVGGGDEKASDAQDAPLLGDDGAAAEAGASDDGGAPLLDTGAQDTQGLDSEAIDTTMVFLDAQVDTSSADVEPDTAPDLAADKADAGNCIQQIVSNGYSFGGAQPCSACKANSSDTTSPGECTAMIDCVEADWPACSSGACHLDCLHSVSGDGVVDTCVTYLVHASCGAGF